MKIQLTCKLEDLIPSAVAKASKDFKKTHRVVSAAVVGDKILIDLVDRGLHADPLVVAVDELPEANEQPQ